MIGYISSRPVIKDFTYFSLASCVIKITLISLSFKNRLNVVSTSFFMVSTCDKTYFHLQLDNYTLPSHFFIRFQSTKILSLCPTINLCLPRPQLLQSDSSPHFFSIQLSSLFIIYYQQSIVNKKSCLNHSFFHSVRNSW